MNISSPDFVRDLTYRGYLETQWRGSYDLRGLKKNGMWLPAASSIGVITTRQHDGYGTYPAGIQGYIWRWKSGGYSAKGVGK